MTTTPDVHSMATALKDEISKLEDRCQAGEKFTHELKQKRDELIQAITLFKLIEDKEKQQTESLRRELAALELEQGQGQGRDDSEERGSVEVHEEEPPPSTMTMTGHSQPFDLSSILPDSPTISFDFSLVNVSANTTGLQPPEIEVMDSLAVPMQKTNSSNSTSTLRGAVGTVRSKLASMFSSSKLSLADVAAGSEEAGTKTVLGNSTVGERAANTDGENDVDTAPAVNVHSKPQDQLKDAGPTTADKPTGKGTFKLLRMKKYYRDHLLSSSKTRARRTSRRRSDLSSLSATSATKKVQMKQMKIKSNARRSLKAKNGKEKQKKQIKLKEEPVGKEISQPFNFKRVPVHFPGMDLGDLALLGANRGVDFEKLVPVQVAPVSASASGAIVTV
ncbi:hypothetical protein K474DRAFT_1694701 [Panus rudis PR-1116 ss-1]|nr:hypothetical protein K474DRAFT_1694701 [Panus rudis PR-1116 ss-1]